MRTAQLSTLLGLIALACLSSRSLAGPPVRWSVGVSVGAPVYRPYCYHPYPYYVRPYPLLYPAPVIYEPAPVIVRPAPIVVQPSSSYSVPSTPTFEAPPPTPVQPAGGAHDALLKQLTHPDEKVRADSIMELGRSKLESAVEPLTASLAGDKSPAVRDAAARALGLIGSPRALTALIHAAQADPERDVRHSAQFAVEIIRSNLKR